MKTLYVKNNLCVLESDGGFQERQFLYDYFTARERVKTTVWENDRPKNKYVEEPRALYKYHNTETPYYTMPRGAYDLVPDRIKGLIDTEIDMTNSLTFDKDIVDINYVTKSLQPESGFDLRIDQVKAIMMGLYKKRGLLQLATGCFTYDTEVMLLSGGTAKIGDLAQSTDSGYYVYSSTPDGRVVPGKVLSAHETKRVVKLLQVHIDDGSVIECTPEHPFMLRNGEYKNAEELSPDDSLMPLYLYINGRPKLRNNLTGRKEFVHRVVANGVYDVPKGYHIHHKDENVHNNDPSNLDVISSSEHTRIHSKNYHERNPGKLTQHLLDYIRDNPDHQSKAASIAGKITGKTNITKYNKSDKGRNESKNRAEHMRDLVKNYKETDPERYEFINLKKKVGTIKANCKRHHDNYPSNCDKCKDKFDELVSKLVGIDPDYTPDNHRVVKVEEVLLEEPVPVYDLEVEDYHNFAIKTSNDSGVFVHNSGKTEIMSSIIRILNKFNPDMHVLVIEPTDVLVTKTAERFSKYKLDAVTYKVSRDDEIDLNHTVTVAHVTSVLNDLEKNPLLLEGINAVFWDESHHIMADTWIKLNTALINAEYNIGVSALVVDEKNVQETVIKNLSYGEALAVANIGKILIHVPTRYYIERGILATPVVFQVHNDIKITGSSLMFKGDAKSLKKLNDGTYLNDWHVLKDEGISGKDRSELTAKVSKVFTDKGRKVLILVGTKEQAFQIGNEIVRLDDSMRSNIGISFGSRVAYTLNEDTDIIKSELYAKFKGDILKLFDSGELQVLISTNHLDEGVDLSNLDVCMLASGGKKDRRIIQRIGRALRLTKTGRYAYVVDFTDTGSDILSYHSALRMGMYEDLIEVPKDLIFKNLKFEDLPDKFKILERL